MRSDIAAEAFKAAPPVTVTAMATVGGLTINEILGLATLVYVGLQAAYLIWKWRKESKQGRRK